jgi:hypothetical protein
MLYRCFCSWVFYDYEYFRYVGKEVIVVYFEIAFRRKQKELASAAVNYMELNPS